MKIVSLSEHIEYSSEIAQWYYDEWVDTSSPLTIADVEKRIRDKVERLDEIPHYYVALENDNLLGVVELKFRENKNHLDYVHWLGGLYVNQKERSKNVASQLIQFAKTRVSEIGVEAFYLQCKQDLVPMYEKHGFVKLHEAKHGNWETMIMVCRI